MSRGSGDAPALGRMSGTAIFDLKVGLADTVKITVQADPTNSSVDDLVDDVNTALETAGLGGSVVAGHEGNRITLAMRDPFSEASLKVIDPNATTVSDLHFAANQTAVAEPRGTLSLALAQAFVNAGVTLNINLHSSVGGLVLASATTSAVDGRATLDLTDNKRVTGADLAAFQGCPDLRSLRLSKMRIADANLAAFKDCKSLTELDLRDTPVGDAGLAHFAGVKVTVAFQFQWRLPTSVPASVSDDEKSIVGANSAPRRPRTVCSCARTE
jgi:hypothetical protein